MRTSLWNGFSICFFPIRVIPSLPPHTNQMPHWPLVTHHVFLYWWGARSRVNRRFYCRRRHSRCNQPGGTPGFPVLGRCDHSPHRIYLPYLIWTIPPCTTAAMVTAATRRPRTTGRTTTRNRNPPDPSSLAVLSISGISIMSTISASVWTPSRAVVADGEERGNTSSFRRLARRTPMVSKLIPQLIYL